MVRRSGGSRGLLGGIEAGGTKFVCAVGTGPDDLRAEARLPTTTPGETIGRAVELLRRAAGDEPLAAVGVASFGPVDLDPSSPTWGHVTSTPKPGWAGTDLAGELGRSLGVPVGFDTDVNGAALAEYLWGAARGVETFIYLTVGTGIGGGAMVRGRPLHGLVHPEMGHLLIARRGDDGYEGCCPFHDACLEGLASGPAIEGRWGESAESLAPQHPAWELEAHYLALGLANLVCALSPERIIMGGGVMSQQQLLPLVRRKLRELLHGYVQAPAITRDNDEFIRPPGLGPRSGVLGAIALAERAAAGATKGVSTS